MKLDKMLKQALFPIKEYILLHSKYDNIFKLDPTKYLEDLRGKNLVVQDMLNEREIYLERRE